MIGNNHIFVLVVFKALNNIFVCNFLAAASACLLILYPAEIFLAQLVKMNIVSWVAVYKAMGI